jgi:hypothetical protein
MAARLDAIFEIVDEIRPCGVRQTFYQTVVRGLMEKAESDYEKVHARLSGCAATGGCLTPGLSTARAGLHKPTSFSSLEQPVRRTVQTYRRAVWDDRPVRRDGRGKPLYTPTLQFVRREVGDAQRPSHQSRAARLSRRLRSGLRSRHRRLQRARLIERLLARRPGALAR